MTNGVKLQIVFPNMEYEIIDNTVFTNIDNGAWFSLDWWNEESDDTTRKCLLDY